MCFDQTYALFLSTHFFRARSDAQVKLRSWKVRCLERNLSTPDLNCSTSVHFPYWIYIFLQYLIFSWSIVTSDFQLQHVCPLVIFDYQLQHVCPLVIFDYQFQYSSFCISILARWTTCYILFKYFSGFYVDFVSFFSLFMYSFI